MKLRWYLVSLISFILFFLYIDQARYYLGSFYFGLPQECEQANYLLYFQRNDGMYVIAKAVAIAPNVFLTNAHVQVDSHFSLRLNDIDYHDKIRQVVLHPNLDLAVFFLSEDITASYYNFGVTLNGPFFTFHHNDLVYAGYHPDLVSHDSMQRETQVPMLTFQNKAIQAGDSGSALLDNNCKLVGLVTGGQTSMTGFFPQSFYIDLTNQTTQDWVQQEITKGAK